MRPRTARLPRSGGIRTLRAVLFRKVAIIGVGLLGGSLGLALRQRRLAECVHGYVRRDTSLVECRAAGAVDDVRTDLSAVVSGAELVVLCTPIGQMGALLAEACAELDPGVIVTDVGSVKAGVVAEAEPLCRQASARFIGSHPMAGSEKTGVRAAQAQLFEGAVCVVTPTPRSDPAALAQLETLWRAVGMQVIRLAPDVHDALVAHTSHLPQAVAASLAGLVLDPASPPEQARLCAGGFRDGTRIASGSPEMWRDIFLANRSPVVEAIDAFIERLRLLRQAIGAGDAAAIAAFLRTAKERRDAWTVLKANQRPDV